MEWKKKIKNVLGVIQIAGANMGIVVFGKMISEAHALSSSDWEGAEKQIENGVER